MEKIQKIRLTWGKYFFAFALIIAVIIASYLTEVFIFNSHARDEKGYEHDFTMDELKYNGTVDDNGVLEFEDGARYIIIPNDGRRLYSLILEYNLEFDLEIYVYDVPMEEIKADNYKNFMIIDGRTHKVSQVIDSDAEEVILYLKMGENKISFERIGIENNYSFHWQRFLFMICFGISFLVIVFAKEAIMNKPERIFAVICLLMGFSMLMSVPYDKNCWDDETHFGNAYKLSYALTGKDVVWNKAAEKFIDLKYATARSYDDRLDIEAKMDYDGEIETRTEESGSALGYLDKIGIWPMAIGLAIGRGLRMSFTDMFVFARIFNIIIYTVIMYFAIKIIPVGKRLMSSIALLPTLIYMLASYGGDYFINAFAMLGVAVFLYELYTPDKKMSKKHAALFIISMLLAFLMKPIYIPLILIALFLPKEKFSSVKKRRIFLGIVCACCVVVFVPIIFAAGGMSDPRGGDTSVIRQMQYIVSNPFAFSKMFFLFIAKKIVPILFGLELSINFNLYGIRAGALTLLMPMASTFLILTDRSKEGLGKVSIKQRVGILTIVALVICFIFGSMYLGYTPVGAGEVMGVQPRYLVPIMALLFIILPDFEVSHKIPDRLYNTCFYGFALGAIALCEYTFFILK